MKREQKYPDTDTFHFHNANPKGRITGDCVVRAISTAMGKSWDETFEGLTEVAKKVKELPDDRGCYSKYLKQNGWVKRPQPKKDDGKKYTGQEFVRMLPKGHKPIVAHIGTHHMVCIKDNKVWDHWNSSAGCIGIYYEEV